MDGKGSQKKEQGRGEDNAHSQVWEFRCVDGQVEISNRPLAIGAVLVCLNCETREVQGQGAGRFSLVRAHFLVHRWLSSCCVLTWRKG